jgi:hypothetical protein
VRRQPNGANWELISDGHGVHWPDVDEDMTIGTIRPDFENPLCDGPARGPDTAQTALRTAWRQLLLAVMFVSHDSFVPERPERINC